MDIRYERSFAKDLKNVKEKALLDRVKNIIDEVKEAENLTHIKNLRKLKGYKTFYRIRFGDYRIGVEILDDEIIFARFLHRRDIYRYFP